MFSMKRKPKPEKPENTTGKLYAHELKGRAMLLRSSLLIYPAIREQIARDLDALAKLAELHPEVFRDA